MCGKEYDLGGLDGTEKQKAQWDLMCGCLDKFQQNNGGSFRVPQGYAVTILIFAICQYPLLTSVINHIEK